jgi:Na+/H+-dicarboxylate symporter
MVKEFSDKVETKQEIAANRKAQGPLQFLVDLVPSNIIKASSKNNKMLQVIFFAVMFGISIILLPENKTKTVVKFFDEFNNIILKFIDIIMKFAPYGVFALLASLIADTAGGNPDDTLSLFKGLGLYSLTVIIGLMLMIFVVYPILLKLFSKIKYRKFIKGIFPAQLMAFSTSSSAATLPVTMEQAEKEVGISKETAGFVLPIGATINMDGTSLYQAVAAVFIAQVFGYDLDLGQQLTIVLTATLASIGSAAVPGAGIVMLVIVLESIGVPSSGIALIFAVDRILDMLRTTVNVTGDTTVAAIVDSKNK